MRDARWHAIDVKDPAVIVRQRAFASMPPENDKRELLVAALQSYAARNIIALELKRAVSRLKGAGDGWRTSQLVYDCNHSLAAPGAVPKRCDVRGGPGNHAPNDTARRASIDEVHLSFCPTLLRVTTWFAIANPAKEAE